MKTKAFQNNLIKIISEQTGQKSEIVSAYVNAQFEEIEKLLIKTSTAKVDGLGVFRVMKTTSSKKVVFIPTFDNLDEIAKNIYEASAAESSTQTSTLNDEFDSAQPVNVNNTSDKKNEVNNINIDPSSLVKTEEPSPKENNTETANEDPYKTWDDFYTKKKKTYRWGTVALLVIAVALIGVIIATVI